MYYNVCEICGAHLDPGEVCDCTERKSERDKILYALLVPGDDGQMVMREVLAYGNDTRI